MCDNCDHKAVCGKCRATGGNVKACEHLRVRNWIPVTERLPEPGMIVLAYLDKPHPRLNAPYEESALLLQYEKRERIDGVIWEWKRPFSGETVSYNPTHWMPLPALPKGE